MTYLVTLKFGQVSVPELTCAALRSAVSVQFPDMTIDYCSTADLTTETLVSPRNAEVGWYQKIESIVEAPPGWDGGSKPSDSPDYSQFSAVWTIAFCSVVGFYLLSLKIALVLGMVRRA